MARVRRRDGTKSGVTDGSASERMAACVSNQLELRFRARSTPRTFQ